MYLVLLVAGFMLINATASVGLLLQGELAMGLTNLVVALMLSFQFGQLMAFRGCR